MTQPAGQQPQGSFGAPYDPPPGAPGHGYRPPPYASHPGPYGPPAQGSYGPPSQPPGGTGPAGPGGGGRFRGRTGAIVGAVLALVLVAGGGVWFALSGDDDGGKPAAGPAPTAGQGDGKSDGEGESDAELATRLDGLREPGEAKVRWVQSLGVDLPARAMGVYGPWRAGDIVAKAFYRTVSGYSMADGAVRWSLRLPQDICGAPTQPTTDGRIVVVTEGEETDTGADCSVMQMIDLRTGKTGWTKSLPNNPDTQRRPAMAANGATVTFARPGQVHTYRAEDGQELFAAQPRDCQSYSFVSGPRMVALANCAKGHEVQEFDPASGKLKWRYAVEQGWSVEQVYSVSPLVVAMGKGDAWRLVALRDDGTYRSAIDLGTRDVDLGFAGYEVRCGGYLVVSRNRDDCEGVAADDDTFYISTKRKHVEFDVDNRIVAFDLDTGRQKWAADAPLGRRMEPMRLDGGKLLVHVAATTSRGGEIATLAPTGGEPRTLLTHPAATAAVEAGMTAAEVDYEDGRSLLTLPLVGTAEDDEAEMSTKTMLAFGE
ncbi:PQQ-binding-like beta-propeller repeat protein [Streptomyces sp. For3]|uniref:outer membrane protein assembly factor BamB family protein n=1 Tax=Streptomyces silvae TaxID=2803812 RepID=UPI001921D564|nr:PQQ-binding-like beta-propeller repeat protein [Streptomyces silvae]MBL1291981.1 PQQ-binding-like beta-propeller repeat protein [Streptomyces silvae]